MPSKSTKVGPRHVFASTIPIKETIVRNVYFYFLSTIFCETLALGPNLLYFGNSWINYRISNLHMNDWTTPWCII